MENYLLDTLKEQIAMLSKRSKECKDSGELASLSSAMAALFGELRAVDADAPNIDGVQIETMNVSECAERLRNVGFHISQESVALCFEEGRFPFGFCIHGEKRARFIIYTKEFNRWVLQHGVRTATAEQGEEALPCAG